MRKGLVSTVFLLLCGSTLPLAAADSKAILPDVSIYKAMLQANRETGWVQFRNYDGKQLIYFTALQSMHCRLSDIRYSINSDALDQHFPVAECNPNLPFNMPENDTVKYIYLSLPKDSVRTLSIQAIWDDGAGSEVITYEPCPDVGEATCAAIANVNAPAKRKDGPKPSSAAH